jgi:cell division septum initiation protein DivIVA
MRVTIPEEIKKSQQLLSQRDRILAQAQEEANRTISLAREKAEKLVENDPVTQAAQIKAEQIIAQARMESELTKKETDAYILDSLAAMEQELQKISAQVRNGIAALKKDLPGDSG